MKKLSVFFSAFLVIACSHQTVLPGNTAIVPRPVSMQTDTGSFYISKKTVVVARDEENKKIAGLLNDYLETVYGFTLPVQKNDANENFILLSTKTFIRAPEVYTYQMEVKPQGISISGDSHNMTFYGMQTLLQMLPVDVKKKGNLSLQIPAVQINDHPRFDYRGMHLDVCRHIFPVAFVKKYIDYLARHKMNYFHWHLTDDQGWRIEIKKYPELTNTGGWRNGTIIGRYPGTGNDNERYGGFYTQEQVKEIVQYAADRYITVIPEIEMPGHASAAIASYPWLSCFPEEPTVIPSHPSEKSQQLQAQGVKKLVQETWGVFDDVFCAGNDSTFMLLQDVMDEVLALFPSQYIHAGGDESPKTNWKKCPKCQARIKAEGLKDEHELQSYFIQRMEKYLNSKGRTLIGWDEILEGGLAPNAVVMSWRGMEGGIASAREKHNVIMTPGNPVYFDHSQTRNEDSLVIGGYNPLEAVYAFEPVPKELDSAAGKYIMGAQANLWTEYITNPSKVEYMVFPRMSALSEVLWSPAKNRDWAYFTERLPVQMHRYQLWGANYSKAFYDVSVNLQPSPGYNGLQVQAVPRDSAGELRYRFNNTKSIYGEPLLIDRSGDLQFQYFRNGQMVNQLTYSIQYNKATGKKVSIAKAPNERYPGQNGPFSLVNGIYSNKGLSHPDWLGYIGDDIEATIDLGAPGANFSQVRVHTIHQPGSWVYAPKALEVSVSEDGKNFRPLGSSPEFVTDILTMGWMTVNFPAQQARYIKVRLLNYGVIPDGQPESGNKAWVFADEVQVN
ncbi:MAG: family 20 glycosylhydrolase [Flavisolibacter sp.]